MASGGGVAPAHWAVLIGIDFYVGERCLQGSVRDVETAKQYLEAGPTPVDIAILTATTPSDPGSRHPTEGPVLWPTYDNVLAKLKRVLEKAKGGDFVYIHYSGHGTRRKGDEFTHPTGNLAFVLFDDKYGSRYLRGETLAKCLREMVEQKLLVTLVLDCCHSGSVLRAGRVQGADIRAIDYNPAVDATSPQDPDPFGPDSAIRGAQMLLQPWFINPDGDRYTILTACGPHERAWELKTEGGERRGALSYFLVEALSALRKSGVALTHQSLYQHLQTKFHASWPQQTPMRYGKQNLSFFGGLCIAPSVGFTSVYRADGARLCLSAGEAHGVHQGDEYLAYPFDTPEDGTGGASVLLRVETVHCLTSDVVGVEETTAAAAQIRTGWKARPMTQLSSRKTRVRLMASAASQLQRTEAVKQQRFLHLCTEGEDTEPCIFHVAVNEHNEYEILDGSLERIASLPAISLDIPGASNHVMDTLQHIATFKFFEGIENQIPNASFENSFTLSPLDGAEASSIFKVKHGDTWGFRVENRGDRPLYLAIFDFTPSWQITNLVSQASDGTTLVVQPKDEDGAGKEEVRLKMEVPPLFQGGQRQCEDIIKVFITSKQTSFPSMVLPKLPVHGRSRKKATRGKDDQLLTFLSELTTPFRGRDHAQEEWFIEDYPLGYPRFSALIASHDSFHLCRRFSNLRARLLLLKQDRLSLLEKRLEKIDREEVELLSLGSSRDDTNSERISILVEIDAALADYDALIERNHRVLSLEDASYRDVASLQDWVDGNGCIARQETAYLSRARDLVSVTSPDDGATTWLGVWAERCRVSLYTRIGYDPRLNASRDPNVYIFPRSSITWVARMLMTPFVVVLLMAPVIICSLVGNLAARLVIIVAATTGFVAVLSGLTRAKTIELVVAGATYTTVLIVFISNTNTNT
ncbi:caspase domain-containing protein [Lasiosphaeria miniovina]|uniref:Caspase domain-containing protein n=1 Tax=Lasiosphaeria miniovina TaxID=1954250 RepID=A0AA40AL31_9PEZI|nr:caspase domain-containing protein [Lasiosphaeria miniovina]KAK0717750.1 caspase domain-containing protein [Lasiosphaeria miniovina]